MRLLLIVGDQDSTRTSFPPLRAKLDESKLPYTYKELEGIGHNLGKYYELTGKEFVTFLGSKMEKPAEK
ncbi:MAG: hypothetical protein WD875_16450 [Pirellulales bacterium]